MAVDRKHLEKNWAEALKILESMKEEELIVLIEEAQLVRARKEAERVKNARTQLRQFSASFEHTVEIWSLLFRGLAWSASAIFANRVVTRYRRNAIDW